MQEFQFASWTQFRTTIVSSFAAVPLERRRLWWFRGQSKATHLLEPTIDRDRASVSDADRERLIAQLLLEFRVEAMLVSNAMVQPPDDGFELLARHHGLPSPLIDFTRSPWIAIYIRVRKRRSVCG